MIYPQPSKFSERNFIVLAAAIGFLFIANGHSQEKTTVSPVTTQFTEREYAIRLFCTDAPLASAQIPVSSWAYLPAGKDPVDLTQVREGLLGATIQGKNLMEGHFIDDNNYQIGLNLHFTKPTKEGTSEELKLATTIRYFLGREEAEDSGAPDSSARRIFDYKGEWIRPNAVKNIALHASCAGPNPAKLSILEGALRYGINADGVVIDLKLPGIELMKTDSVLARDLEHNSYFINGKKFTVPAASEPNGKKSQPEVKLIPHYGEHVIKKHFEAKWKFATQIRMRWRSGPTDKWKTGNWQSYDPTAELPQRD